MSCNHRHQASEGDVPFSWESKPGMSKVTPHVGEPLRKETLQLPPPPCPTDCPKISGGHVLFIPLPPCPFQPPHGSSNMKKGNIEREEDDPFLAAYKKCTKSGMKQGEQVEEEKKRKQQQQQQKKKRRGGGFGLGIDRLGFSCRNSTSLVVEGGMVRLSSPPPGGSL